MLLFLHPSTVLMTHSWIVFCELVGPRNQSNAQRRVISPDSGEVYHLNGCSILDAAWPPSWWYSSDWRWTDCIATRASDHVCSYSGCDMVAEAAGVGWVSIRHRIPAKPASSHTAISANLPLCANNSTDVLAFWRSFQACLVCAMPQQPVVFSFPITKGTLELKSARVLSLPRNGWVIEGTQVTGFSIAWAGKCRGCG